MPSHFHSTCQSAGGPSNSIELLDRLVERVREEEGIGLAAGAAGSESASDFPARSARAKSAAVGCAPMCGVAHQPLRHALGIDARHRGQRLRDLQLRHADAEAAGDQLEVDEALVVGAARPTARAGVRASASGARPRSGSRCCSATRPGRAAPASRGRRQQQRDGLGQVADGLVALVEQPLGQARQVAAPARAAARVGTIWRGLPPARKYTAQAASAAVASQVALQRGLLLARGGGARRARGRAWRSAFMRGCGAPSAAVGSAWAPLQSWLRHRRRRTRSRSACASSPCSVSQRTSTGTLPWVTRTRSAPGGGDGAHAARASRRGRT